MIRAAPKRTRTLSRASLDTQVPAPVVPPRTRTLTRQVAAKDREPAPSGSLESAHARGTQKGVTRRKGVPHSSSSSGTTSVSGVGAAKRARQLERRKRHRHKALMEFIANGGKLEEYLQKKSITDRVRRTYESDVKGFE